MSEVAFLLNGTPVQLTCASPTVTLLDWLREERGLTGTKEGCNEGDCGACTVMVSDAGGARALNACILFLPQLEGRAVRTVEGVGSAGAPHPVQTAMVAHHGSQCGFCTPGFVMSMVTAHAEGATDHNDQLAGNLCRCTGYAPIIRAAEAAAGAAVPDWIARDEAARAAMVAATDAADATTPTGQAGATQAAAGQVATGQVATGQVGAFFRPRSADALADWYMAHPQATLIAGATDVGLWVTKQLRDLSPVAFLGGIADLRGVRVTDTDIHIGAMTTLADLREAIAPHHPDFAELIRRYGSAQVRNAATLGGNIANGSPIGDSPPALIALGAVLHLRRGATRRTLRLEDFFIEYGKQDRQPGEFVEAVTLPRQPDRLKCYKISKRFDQDISALCGCFNITVTGGHVSAARMAFGGMAGTPARARKAEAALNGAPWDRESVERAMVAMAQDFAPMSDMRASAAYRMQTAQNLLMRYFLEDHGIATRVLEVRA